MMADGRSPWSNAYIPKSPGAPTPSSKLRQLEVSLNSAFVTYKEMYFEGGVSSVYLWDLEEQQGRELAFAGVVLLKKSEFGSSTYPCKKNLETDSSPTYRCGTYRFVGLASRIRMSRKRSISEIQTHLDGNASIKEQDYIKVRKCGWKGLRGCGIEWKYDQAGMSSQSFVVGRN
jgi:hypothetical protein